MQWPTTMDSVPLPHRQCANFDLMTLHRPDPIHAHLQDSVKVLAKSLVRNRQYVTKMHHMKANLQAVSLKITVRATRFENVYATLCPSQAPSGSLAVFVQFWDVHEHGCTSPRRMA